MIKLKFMPWTNCRRSYEHRQDKTGFTLIETAVAVVIILVALLGVVFTFTYAINYNRVITPVRRQLAVLQQQAELIRAAKYTPTIMDPLLQAAYTRRRSW